MRIWLVASGYPTERDPLHEIFPFDQAKALAAAGHEIVYLSIDLRSLRHRRKLGKQTLLLDGIPIENESKPLGRIPCDLLDRIGSRSFDRLAGIAAGKYGSPDIIHAHSAETASFVARASFRRWQAPFLVTEHWSSVHRIKPDSKLFRRMAKTYAQADHVIAVSQALARVIRDHFKIPVEVIPNLFDLEMFLGRASDTTEKALRDNSGNFHFVSTGHLIKGKGMDLLLPAFAQAFAAEPNVDLTIFGDGEEQEKLKLMSRDLAIEKRVHFRGRVTRRELATEYRQAHAFVLASRGETFGVAYLEALATGLPSIATRCGGPEDFIHENNGLLVDMENISALASALKQIRQNYTRYDAAAISREAAERFSGERIVRELEAVYRRFQK